MNPLVNVAIYGATRKIQSRALKVKETLTNFLTRPSDAITRMERNELILTTAKKAAESLLKPYKESYEILKKYDEDKDSTLLQSTEPEPIDYADIESYFAAGNWAHPYLDAQNTLKNDTNNQEAMNILERATKARQDAIAAAKKRETENIEHDRKVLQYNQLLEDSQKLGREGKKFDKALELLREAVALLPDKMEGRWGLATALHHTGELDESIKVYQQIVNDFPDQHKFCFEMGQVMMLNGQSEDGVASIKIAMEASNDYDSFLFRLGQLYVLADRHQEATLTMEKYTNLFPHDYNGWRLLGDCFAHIGDKEKSKAAMSKAQAIKSTSK